jgi:HD-GYP domain-containing protein (c-di-GMP phosphodiesterase class II)
MQSILAERLEIDEKLLRIAPQIDEFEAYADAHAKRIGSIADALAAEFRLASRDRFILQQAALMHDIGELKMNRDYIGVSRTLKVEERLDLRRHPVIGEQETSKLGLPRAVQLLVRWHHEWWNGAGYPDCIEGEQIPLAARILRLSDTYSALTSARPFRPAWSHTDALKYLTEWAGIEFDPLIVKVFVRLCESRRRSVPARPATTENN